MNGRGGRSPGLREKRPPSGGGGGRGAASTVARCHTGCPRSQATSSSIAVSRGGRTASRSPRAPRRGRPCRPARSVPGQRPGGRDPFPGTGWTCAPPPSDSVPAGRAARVCASLEGPRAARGRVGGRSRAELSCATSVGGRECAVGEEPGAAEVGRQAQNSAGPSRRSRSPGEGGDRSRRARGRAEDGVSRLAAVVAHQHVGQARACAYLGGGEQALTGTSSARSSGTWIVAPAREIHGPDSTAGHRVPRPGRWGHRSR